MPFVLSGTAGICLYSSSVLTEWVVLPACAPLTVNLCDLFLPIPADPSISLATHLTCTLPAVVLTMRSLAIYLLQQKIKELISRIWIGACLLHLLFLSTITDLLVSFSMSICLSKFFQAQLIKQGVISNMDFVTISIILLLLQQNRSQQVRKDKEEEKLHGNSTCAQSGYRWWFCPESSHKVTSQWSHSKLTARWISEQPLQSVMITKELKHPNQIWYINTAWLNCQ